MLKRSKLIGHKNVGTLCLEFVYHYFHRFNLDSSNKRSTLYFYTVGSTKGLYNLTKQLTFENQHGSND